jgi:hypothetical protein
MPAIPSTSGRLHSEFVRLLFLRLIGKLTVFFITSGVQLPQPDRDQFHYLRVVFSSQFKAKVDNILVKAASLRVNLNIDGSSIASKSNTHPSH